RRYHGITECFYKSIVDVGVFGQKIYKLAFINGCLRELFRPGLPIMVSNGLLVYSDREPMIAEAVCEVFVFSIMIEQRRKRTDAREGRRGDEPKCCIYKWGCRIFET